LMPHRANEKNTEKRRIRLATELHGNKTED